MSSHDPLDPNLVKALGHPLRLRLLEAIIDDEEQSPVVLARRFGQPLASVSRHVRILRDLGFVELTRTEPRRGAVEHFYRAIRLAFIDDAHWDRMPVALRRGLARQTFRKVFAEASVAGAYGGFDPDYAHLDRIPLELDEAGRREVSEALHDFMRQAESIQRRSDARRSTARPTDNVTSTRIALLHFEAIDPSEPNGTEATRRPGVAALRPRFS
jgi:DNA-binding transcriptional ArsR family regulator